MATRKDIIDQRDADAKLLDDKKAEAIGKQNNLPIGDPQRAELTGVINKLNAKSTELAEQELKKDLDSKELDKAFGAITKATDELKKEAAKMKGATSFINNIGGMLGAATKVVDVLKNGG